MNAAGGIYWRSAPDWTTGVQVANFGFFTGTIISVSCYQAGAANVPGSADYMWEYATDVAGPGYGSGWINEHFINDGSAINQPSPGVPPCNSPPPPPASITASLGGPFGCGFCNSLDIAVQNFPTGTYSYYCHDNSGPGGSDTIFYSNSVSVTSANQNSWPGVFCYDSAPYTAYLVMDGVTSNSVSFGSTPPPPPPPPASITAAVGGQYGCGSCNSLDIAVQNFPTGTYAYDCHDNSGPGGSDTIFYSNTVSVVDPNQSTWPGVFCYDSAPYTAYLVMDGVTSNSVSFGSSPPPPSGGGGTGGGTGAGAGSGTSGGLTGGGGSSLISSIYNAAGGVFYRNSPHWSDTTATPGVGVYDGDQVQLLCGALGDAVGPSNNTAWSYLTNLSRNVGNGWVNEHFINDSAPINGFVAGEPRCGPNGPGTPAGPGTPGSPVSGAPAIHSVFFSPFPDPWGNVGLKQPPADVNLGTSAWSSGCSSSLAVEAVPSGTNTLAGWSSGRLGPIYFLDAASLPQVTQIHRIILFDPGSTSDFTNSLPWPFTLIPGVGSCDTKYDINGLLAGFLSSDPNNRLLILTGAKSEMKTGGTYGRPTFAGLWKYYLAGIWNQPFAWQALICDYDNMPHPQVLHDFASVINHPSAGPNCPTAAGDGTPLQWNP